MAKKPLKLQTLAKLRQFSQGMDPGKFLQTEWRQVVRALEQSYVEVDDAQNVTTNVATGFLCATNTGTYTSSQDIILNDCQITQNIGTVYGNYLFIPANDGKFYIEANGEWVVTATNPVSGSVTYTSNLLIKTQAGVTIGSSMFQTLFYPITMQLKVLPGSLGVIADLTVSNGVYFSCSLSGANLRNLNFKITRIK